jgi:hypothetical protein|tara:strand:+ start:162 stop:431 length:270 start_codon:yes stop_codon:yes gene_type:complete
MPKTTREMWSALEHDFLVACAKADIPFNWVDRAVGRIERSAASHAEATGIPPSKWRGRVSYNQTRKLRAKMAMITAEFAEKGLTLGRPT